LYRVLSCLAVQHDHRLVLLAAAVCVAAAFTAFHIYGRASAQDATQRYAWIVLAGVSAAAGIWSTHFIASLAYEPGFPTSYHPGLTVASLVVAAVFTTTGFAVATLNSRQAAVAGGAAIGFGLTLMHYMGMYALVVPGGLSWDSVLVIVSIVIGLALTSAAMLAWQTLERRRARWASPALFALGICSLHFVAMGAVTIVPDPTVLVPSIGLSSAVGNMTLALAVTGVSTLILLAGLSTVLITHHTTTGLNKLLESQNALLHERERALEAQNEQLDAALKNMTQGLAMFDALERLILANDRYSELYGHAAGELKPGMTLSEIIELRLSRGLYPGVSLNDVLAKMRERVARQKGNHLISMPGDGRIFSISVQPRSDNGWVVTVHDITAHEALNARLAEQNDLLKQRERALEARNEQLDAALSNMSQGLAMFDRELNLVICNQRFGGMYGLPDELVAAGTPLSAIIEHRIAHGEFQGQSAAEVTQALASAGKSKKPAHRINQLPDGRYVAVSMQPMPGGGAVTTHHDITDQRRSEAKIAHMALHDTLTGLPNRVLLNERLEHALTRAKRGELVATLLLDLDHFKTVNDTLGHPAGDKLLQLVAERLRELVRETDTIARMGGDEFAILQVGIDQPSDATTLARRIIDVVGELYMIDGHHVVIGTSVGIAVGPVDGVTPEQLLRNADLALYRAKGEGRSTYRFFEPEMDALMRARRAMEYDLRNALAAGQFELYYQPIVNLERNGISGFEALIRWRHPARGLVPPGDFVPLAEEIGVIVPMGEWAIRRACAVAATWPGDIKVAVNLSPAQFKDTGLVEVVVSALASSGLAPQRLELEITETVLLEDNAATLGVLFQLRDLGVRIAMDDFGTGYSSLSYLQSFPFDKIKIDRTFVKDIADAAGSRNIVRAVAAMAIGLGMETTAEGVETAEQLATIRAEGCTEMQGYLFSRPLPEADVERLLQDMEQAPAASSDTQATAA
jgi:diguanylate cyclase (GGDEF)-like protein